MIEMKDALGNDIVLGNKYGYTSSAGSTITVVVGVAEKTTEAKVTLHVESRRNYLYGEPCALWSSPARTSSVHPCHLFPVA